jgi:hypothetical protein
VLSIITQDTQNRFWNKVTKKENGCWIWIAAINNHGYGVFRLNHKNMLAHRIAYELIKGKIPDGLTLDHLCKNPPCVNPDHLESVTLKENILRGESVSAKKAQQTHCKHDHLLIQENCYPKAWAKGMRVCKICSRITSAERLKKYRLTQPSRHNKTKIYCKRGHLLSGNNLLKHGLEQNIRRCKICKRLAYHNRKGVK